MESLSLLNYQKISINILVRGCTSKRISIPKVIATDYFEALPPSEFTILST